jgi:alcohol dehydrogenase
LKAKVSIPERLSQAGVTQEFLPQMARDAFESGNAQVVNPRKPTLEEVTALYQEAL